MVQFVYEILICFIAGLGAGLGTGFAGGKSKNIDLKTAVGTSVFVMTFTALTGAVSHFAISGKPNFQVLILCVLFTFIWARIGARWANKADVKN